MFKYLRKFSKALNNFIGFDEEVYNNTPIDLLDITPAELEAMTKEKKYYKQLSGSSDQNLSDFPTAVCAGRKNK